MSPLINVAKHPVNLTSTVDDQSHNVVLQKFSFSLEGHDGSSAKRSYIDLFLLQIRGMAFLEVHVYRCHSVAVNVARKPLAARMLFGFFHHDPNSIDENAPK